MKDLLQCWWLDLGRTLKILVLISALFIPLFSITTIFAISPENRIEIFHREFTIYMDWLIVVMRLSIFPLLYFLIADLFAGYFLIPIIRFKKVFGFLPPNTQEGKDALQSYFIDDLLKKLANRLQNSYDQEEKLLRIRNSNSNEELKRLISEVISVSEPKDIPSRILALEKDFSERKKQNEKNLRDIQGYIKMEKRDFYSSRNLAKSIGFDTQESYKKYLEV